MATVTTKLPAIIDPDERLLEVEYTHAPGEHDWSIESAVDDDGVDWMNDGLLYGDHLARLQQHISDAIADDIADRQTGMYPDADAQEEATDRLGARVIGGAA